MMLISLGSLLDSNSQLLCLWISKHFICGRCFLGPWVTFFTVFHFWLGIRNERWWWVVRAYQSSPLPGSELWATSESNPNLKHPERKALFRVRFIASFMDKKHLKKLHNAHSLTSTPTFSATTSSLVSAVESRVTLKEALTWPQWTGKFSFPRVGAAAHHRRPPSPVNQDSRPISNKPKRTMTKSLSITTSNNERPTQIP